MLLYIITMNNKEKKTSQNKIDYIAEYNKNRLANDPDFKAEFNRKVKDKVKEKYQNDEVFREAKKEKNRLYQQKLRETKKLYEALLIQSAVAQ